jgi:hypothetical protein
MDNEYRMVEELIRRARRRFVVNEALGQLAFAASTVIAGLTLLLILGTRYLEWWSLGLFALAGLATGAWRVFRRVPGAYATAVSLDRNAGLRDTLSTAHYFSSVDAEASEFQQNQRRQAEDAASRIDLEAAVPFRFPKALYAMAALTLLASGLVALRYGMGHGLDLRPPLTEVLFEDQAAKQAKKPQQVDPLQRKRLEMAESLMAKLGVPMNPDDRKQESALDKAIDEALTDPGKPGKGEKGDAAGKAEDGKAVNDAAQSPDGDPLDGEKGSAGDQNKGKNSDKSGAQGDKGNAKNGTGGSSSLLSKLKDAVSNMLSKSNQDNSGSSKPQPQNQAAKSDKSPGDKNNSAKGQEGQNPSDAEDGEPSDEPQAGQQPAQGKDGSKDSKQTAQAGSGAGSQDGAKDVKAAEQLKAMGKISEIIGKRAATVTGETTIEVQSGNQQLRTAYSNKSAAHGEADSDVSRDEIPVSVQSYVQQYFEQVRKAGAAPKAKAAETTP